MVNPAEDLSLNAPPHHVEARLVLILGFGTGMLIGVFFMIYIVLAVVSAPADSPGQALQLFHAATTPLM